MKLGAVRMSRSVNYVNENSVTFLRCVPSIINPPPYGRAFVNNYLSHICESRYRSAETVGEYLADFARSNAKREEIVIPLTGFGRPILSEQDTA